MKSLSNVRRVRNEFISLPKYLLVFINDAFFPKEVTLSNGKVVKPVRSLTPYVMLFLILLILISMWATNFSLAVFIERGNEFFVILRKMIFPPNLSYFSKVQKPLMDTIKMSLLGSFIGAVLAFPVAILASSNINKNKVSLTIVRFILSLLRTMPALIYASIMTYILGFGTFAGTVAIVIFTFAIVSKMLFEHVESIHMGAFEALESTGATKPKSFMAALFPEIFPTYLSIALYSFEINVRYAAILGYVGAGGIGLLISENIGWREYDNVGAILITILITVMIIEWTSRSIRKRLL